MQGGGKSFSSVTRHEKFQLTRNCTNMTAFSCSFSALKGGGRQAAEMREHLTVLEPKRRKLPLQNSEQLKLMKILAPSHSHMKWSHKNGLGTVYSCLQSNKTEMLQRKNVGNYTFKSLNKIRKAISISTCSRIRTRSKP